MAFGGEFTPPQYSDIVAEHSSVGGCLKTQDFLPFCIDQGGVFKSSKYEPFSQLIVRANLFLRDNWQWEAKTCESIEFKCSRSNVKTEQMSYLEYGETLMTYIRGLRLWLVPRQTKEPQQLGYINIVPAALSQGLGWPDFTSLDDTLLGFNERTKKNPGLVPGKIITVETQEMKATSYSDFDPDKNYWRQRGDYGQHFIIVIRVFYELFTNQNFSQQREEIGIADFKPNVLKEGGVWSQPKYEPFSNVIQAASYWCSQQRTIRYCNTQTFEVKVKRGNQVDTKKMSYMERGNGITFYVRILRVAFVTITADQVAPPLILTCKNFIPCTLVIKTLGNKEYESLSITLRRIEEWLRATGGKILSCETAAMRWNSGGERKRGIETSYTYNVSDRSEFWIYVIRIFLDGYYPEPPAEVLSAQPIPKDESCILV